MTTIRKLINKYWPRRPYMTCMVVVAILYFTLWPDPVPDTGINFPFGFDKVVHALMFGSLAFAALLDTQRSRDGFTRPRLRTVIIIGIVSALFGGIIEILQKSMMLGRSAEIYDFVTDTVGVALALAIARLLTK